MMVSFVLSFFPRDIFDEILNLIESVPEGFPSCSSNCKDGQIQSSKKCRIDLTIAKNAKIRCCCHAFTFSVEMNTLKKDLTASRYKHRTCLLSS